MKCKTAPSGAVFLCHFQWLLMLLIVFKSNKKGDGEQQYPNQ